jgi:branched-chain amino acid aminotransferase
MAYWNEDHYYLHRAEAHLDRFRQGAGRMGLSFPWTTGQLLAGIHELLAHEPVGTQYIRPIAYRRAPELWVTGNDGMPVDTSIFTVRVARDIDAPISCHISPVERISSRAIPGHTKVSGAYVNSFNARKTAERAGFDDGLMLDREGRLAEASAANFFAIEHGRLITPPINPDVFPGVTRSTVIDLANEIGADFEEVDIRPSDLVEIDAAFLSSTLMEIRAISKIGDNVLATAENVLYRNILTSFRRLTHQ